MKLVACALLAVLVLFALHSETYAIPDGETNPNCQGTDDRRCPQVLCGPEGVKGWRRQDNSKPLPQCCGGPIC